MSEESRRVNGSSIEQAISVLKAAGYRVSKPHKSATVPALNAIGKPYGVNYDPNYKIKTGLTRITRLYMPQGFFRVEVHKEEQTQ
jgi:hypothetical protein